MPATDVTAVVIIAMMRLFGKSVPIIFFKVNWLFSTYPSSRILKSYLADDSPFITWEGVMQKRFRS